MSEVILSIKFHDCQVQWSLQEGYSARVFFLLKKKNLRLICLLAFISQNILHSG